jgi:transposase
MGRSRGGLTTKIHALVDAHGLPIQIKLTEGQAHDGGPAAELLATLGKECMLLADRGYDSDALRTQIAKQGGYANIRPKSNRVEPPVFSPFAYKLRNRVERFFNKLKHYRAIATRFDRHDDNFMASVKLAAIRIWLRFNESVA